MAKDLGIVSSLGLSNHLTITELKMTDLHSNADLVRSLVFYRDGNLYWKKSVANHVKIGQKAGYLVGGGDRTNIPRFKVQYDKKMYRVHRLIYLMHHNVLPKYIDHIDGNPHNNRIENLREVTRSENQFNKAMCSNNTSGFRGVNWHKHSKSWVVRVCTKGKTKILGYFKDLELAGLVADEARNLYHGKYAKQF